MKKIMAVLSLAMLLVQPLHAKDDNWQANLIQGFSAWQASRVEKLLVSQSFDRLADNQYAKALFPNTVDAIQFNSAMAFKSYAKLLPVTLRQDLDVFEDFGRCVAMRLKSLAGGHNGNAIMTMIIDANNAVRGLDVRQQRPKSTDEFTVIAFLGDYQCERRSENGTPSPPLTAGPAATATSYQSSPLKDGMDKAIEEVLERTKDKNNDEQCSIKQHSIENKNYKWIELMLCGKEWVAGLVQVLDTVNRVSDGASNDYHRIYAALKLIEYFGVGREDWTKFQQVQRHGLFFASLLDAANDTANSSEKIAAALDAYVDEQAVYARKNGNGAALYASFYVKAPDGEGRIQSEGYESKFPCCDGVVFLNSHFGAVYWQPDGSQGISSDLTHIRPFGPVGIEVKLLSFSTSYLSVTAAPIDIGAYIYNELNNDSYSASFSDISSPSFYLAWTAKKRPFSLLLGYQKNYVISDTEEVDNFFAGVAFDLPIFTLW